MASRAKKRAPVRKASTRVDASSPAIRTRGEYRAELRAKGLAKKAPKPAPIAGPSLAPKGKNRRPTPGRAIEDLSLWQQVGRLGGKLTPADITTIIRAADTGELRALMDLANECRQKDCHLSAVLTVAEESIAGLPWKLTLPEGAKAKDKKAAKWAEAVLRATPTFRKLIAYLAGAPYYGFDVNEILWGKDEKKRAIPKDFAHLSHRRFGFDPYTGTFVLRDPGMPVSGLDFRAVYPNKFVVSQPRANGDAPQREGLCRPLIWMTQFRVWTFADNLRTAEMSWKPWRIGTYKKGTADTRDRDALELILQKLTTSGWAAKPDSMDIDIEWPAGSQTSKSTHEALLNILAQEMSKCVLGQTETTQSSTSSGYAQAKVHDAVRRDIRESRARQIAADITRDLLTPMIALNFANTVVPQFEFLTQDPVDIKAFSEAVKNLAESELTIPAKWVRDNSGMPEPKAGEETIGGKKEVPPALVPGAKPGAKPGEEPDGDEEDDGAPKPEEPDEDEEPETDEE